MNALKQLLCVLLICGVLGCAPAPKTGYIKGNAMGTFYTVQFWTKDYVSQDEVESEIESLLNEFENVLSNWREESWINRFNTLPSGEAIEVPPNAFEVIRLSLELAEHSGGNLDPTVGPLIELWGFGVRRDQVVPQEDVIADALRAVGYEKIVLDETERTIRKTVDGVSLNCSAIAKGHSVDLVASLLKERGIENFLVNIGGEIVGSGVDADNSVWKVGIEQPQSINGSVDSPVSIELSDQAIATSGHTQRYFERDGVRYSHILNPKTGHPVPIKFKTASVVAPTCSLADGLATLALILTGEEMNSLIDHYDRVQVMRVPVEIEAN